MPGCSSWPLNCRQLQFAVHVRRRDLVVSSFPFSKFHFRVSASFAMQGRAGHTTGSNDRRIRQRWQAKTSPVSTGVELVFGRPDDQAGSLRSAAGRSLPKLGCFSVSRGCLGWTGVLRPGSPICRRGAGQATSPKACNAEGGRCYFLYLVGARSLSMASPSPFILARGAGGSRGPFKGGRET